MNNYKIYTSYFTNDVCDGIRMKLVTYGLESFESRNTMAFGEDWKSYVEYHRRFQNIDSSNAMHIMNAFKVVYTEITSRIQLPKEAFARFLLVHNVN
jgi:hypothetical protein